jgi:hypothetical protein
MNDRAKKAMQSRGYRNKNPGNIDWSPANKWQGQIGKESTGNPPRFAVFQTHEHGIRALALLLTTYQDRHNCRTIRQFIQRWAPSSENNTEAYVAQVARHMKVENGDYILDIHEYEDLRPLVEAIIAHELGGQPYPDSVIDEGLRLAGVPKPITSASEAAKTNTGKGAITVAAAASAAATAAPAMQSLATLPQWVGVALVIGVAAVAVAYVLTQRARRAV